jgi:AraC-like DNA-binding protein
LRIGIVLVTCVRARAAFCQFKVVFGVKLDPDFAVLEFDIQNKLTLVSCDSQEIDQLSAYSNRFRLVFVIDGTGAALLGEELFRYEKDSFFLIEPKNELEFMPSQRTRILVMIFGLFRSAKSRPGEPTTSFSNLYQRVQRIFLEKNISQGMRISDEADRNSVSRLIPMLGNELLHPQGYSKEIAINFVFILVNVLARNIENASGGSVNRYDQETNRILNYTKEQVQQNARFTIKDIARGLNISEYNLNKIVIKGTGGTLKSFIAKCQVELFAEP